MNDGASSIVSQYHSFLNPPTPVFYSAPTPEFGIRFVRYPPINCYLPENNIWTEKKRLIFNERAMYTPITLYNATFYCNLYCVYYGTLLYYLRPTIWKMNGPKEIIVKNRWTTFSGKGRAKLKLNNKSGIIENRMVS